MDKYAIIPFRAVFHVLLICFLTGIVAQDLAAWGNTGHRTVGEIAERLLTQKAKKKLSKLLDNESLAFASTFLDEVRSDSNYNHTTPWHQVTIPDGMTYEQIEKEPGGDIIMTIERLIRDLKSGKLKGKEQEEAIKFLCHLIGDIHQPLHVGIPGDYGGNAVRVEWHYIRNYNLHKVWDEGMIDFSNLSYTELSDNLLRVLTKEELEQWQDSGIRDWAYESMTYRETIYDVGDGKLGYRYSYIHFPIVQKRLLQAGVRLAGVLNEIFG